MPLVGSRYSGKFLPQVNLGDKVIADDTICRISVWGIKLGIRCPCDGTVETIFPLPGADVKRDDPLFNIAIPTPAPAGEVVADARIGNETDGAGAEPAIRTERRKTSSRRRHRKSSRHRKRP